MTANRGSTPTSVRYPLPTWVRATVIAVALLAAFDDVMSAVISSAPVTWPLSNGLALLALGVLCVRPAWGAPVMVLAAAASVWFSVPFGLITGVLVLASLVAVATAQLRWVAFHAATVIIWIIVYWLEGADYPQTAFLWDQFWLQGLAVGVGVLIRVLVLGRRAVERKVNELAEQARRIRSEERQSLARDLHDIVAHELTSIVLQVAGRRQSTNPVELRETLSSVDSTARSALAELRTILDLLRADEDPALSGAEAETAGSKPLGAAVQDLGAQLATLGYLPEIAVDLDESCLTPAQRITCIRIMQEASTNIAKYAPNGSACRLEVRQGPGLLTLVTSNDMPSRGGSRAGSGGLGLATMTERARLLDGEINVGQVSDSWRVQILVPLTDAPTDTHPDH